MMPTAPEAAASTPPKQQSLRPTPARHAVLALTVAVYMITYMDRTIIASAMPLIQKEFGFSLITVGWILASFRWGFTLFQLPGAWFGDKIGHADIAVACVIRFTREAHPGVFDVARWPALAAHAERCEALPSFQEIAQPFSAPGE